MVEETIDRIIFDVKAKRSFKKGDHYFLGTYNIESVDSIEYIVDNQVVDIVASGITLSNNTIVLEDNTKEFDSIDVTFNIKSDFDVIPDALKIAALLIIGDLFNNRQEIVIGRSVFNNDLINRVLAPYKKYVTL
jgi:hypothetical protein